MLLALQIQLNLQAGAAPAPPSYVVGGSFLDGKKRKRKTVEEETGLTKPEPLEIVVLGEAPNEIITGLVIPKRQALPRTASALDQFETAKATTKRAKAAKLRAQQIAEDEWLLLN